MLEMVSVIIPVYNVESYLVKCLNSVINQSYSNIEIILVDDGSTDKSSEICDAYAKNDDRIQVIHKINGGLSEARNVGIDYAKGQYITFIDSDDYIAKDYIEYLYNMLIQDDADISIVSNKKVWNDYEKLDELKMKKRSFQSIEAIEDLLYQKHIDNSAWGKMYKKSLFNQIRYPIGKLYEDLGTTYRVFYNADRIIWCNQQKYYYFQRNNSIMNQQFSLKNLDRIDISQQIMGFVQEKAPQIESAAICRFFISNIQVLRELPLNEKQYQPTVRVIYQNMKKYRKYVIFDKRAKLINRIIALCSYLPLCFIQKLGVLYKKIYK